MPVIAFVFNRYSAMLLINARAEPSKIHGLGLIAKQPIPRGTTVWRFKSGFDVKLPETMLDELSAAASGQVLHYAYFHEETRTYVLSSDDDRFTNHSDNPNTEINDDCTVAARDIAEGEEITCNYNQIRSLNFLHGNVTE